MSNLFKLFADAPPFLLVELPVCDVVDIDEIILSDASKSCFMVTVHASMCKAAIIVSDICQTNSAAHI